MANFSAFVMQKCYALCLSLAVYEGTGEGGIRTLGSLLGYGALAKRCFRPLSHLTKICSHGGATCLRFTAPVWQAGAWLETRVENMAKTQAFPICNLNLPTPTSSRARDFIGVANRR